MRIKSDNPEFDRDMSSMGLIKDVEVLKNDMQEIKSLLHELIRK